MEPFLRQLKGQQFLYSPLLVTVPTPDSLIQCSRIVSRIGSPGPMYIATYNYLKGHSYRSLWSGHIANLIFTLKE